MLYPILSHTPLWVWALLAALVALGWTQSRARHSSLARMTVMPLAMVALSLYGTVSVFGGMPAVWAAWCSAALPLAIGISRSALPPGTRYDASRRRFAVPGSWAPLALIMGIFVTKYAVGVALAMHPALARDPLLAFAAALLYGAFSGCFVGRSARLWRLVRRGSGADQVPATLAA